MLFDAHTHLNFYEYTPEEREKLAEEIEASDLSYIIDSGDSVESSRQALEDSHRYSWCYASVGLHPDQAPGYTDEMIEEIEAMAADPMARAIGEIGMDLHYGKEYKERQIELFRKEITKGEAINNYSSAQIIATNDWMNHYHELCLMDIRQWISIVRPSTKRYHSSINQ